MDTISNNDLRRPWPLKGYRINNYYLYRYQGKWVAVNSQGILRGRARTEKDIISWAEKN